MTNTDKLSAEEIREQARKKRYKKAIVNELNLESIRNTLYEILESCEDVRWFTDTEEGLDIICNIMDDNEEEAKEFQMMFTDLSADCERMLEDLGNNYIPDCFDDIMVASKCESYGGGLLGWDEYESDYFGLYTGHYSWAEEESEKRILRLKKSELLECMQISNSILLNYLSIKYRYEDLNASMNILRSKNLGQLNSIRKINEMYEKMQTCDWKKNYEWKDKWEKLTENLAQEVWIN